jgi:hypothetical protein
MGPAPLHELVLPPGLVDRQPLQQAGIDQQIQGAVHGGPRHPTRLLPQRKHQVLRADMTRHRQDPVQDELPLLGQPDRAGGQSSAKDLESVLAHGFTEIRSHSQLFILGRH